MHGEQHLPAYLAINRYTFEAWRHWRILDQRLGQGAYMPGETVPA